MEVLKVLFRQAFSPRQPDRFFAEQTFAFVYCATSQGPQVGGLKFMGADRLTPRPRLMGPARPGTAAPGDSLGQRRGGTAQGY
jgi:hypothetical protein